jgi:hypothetical protein
MQMKEKQLATGGVVNAKRNTRRKDVRCMRSQGMMDAIHNNLASGSPEQEKPSKWWARMVVMHGICQSEMAAFDDRAAKSSYLVAASANQVVEPDCVVSQHE